MRIMIGVFANKHAQTQTQTYADTHTYAICALAICGLPNGGLPIWGYGADLLN